MILMNISVPSAIKKQTLNQMLHLPRTRSSHAFQSLGFSGLSLICATTKNMLDFLYSLVCIRIVHTRPYSSYLRSPYWTRILISIYETGSEHQICRAMIQSYTHIFVAIKRMNEAYFPHARIAAQIIMHASLLWAHIMPGSGLFEVGLVTTVCISYISS